MKLRVVIFSVSVCCDDPCYQGGPHLKLCYQAPRAALATVGDAADRPVESELPGELDTEELKKAQEPADDVITGPKAQEPTDKAISGSTDTIIIPRKDKDIGKPKPSQKIKMSSKDGPVADDLRAPPVPAELKDGEHLDTLLTMHSSSGNHIINMSYETLILYF